MIITFDVETTGTNSKKDQIIEICLQLGFEPGSELKTWRIKPNVPISPGAQKVHGISIEDLKDCKDFKAASKEFINYFQEAKVIIGYNVEFDIGFLQAELGRNGLETLDLKEIDIVDPYNIWRKCEPRNLSSAHKKFTGKELDNAHSAEADVAGTANVLKGMIKHFDLQDSNWGQLAKLSGLSRSNWIGPSNHFQLKDEVVVFGFGKYRNKALVEVAKNEDRSYFNWIIAKDDFPSHVKQILSDAPLTCEESLQKWVKGNLN